MAPSPIQLLIIGLIILVLFGASRLGEVGKGLGDGIRNFKKGLTGDDEKSGDPKQLKGEKGSSSGDADEVADKVPEKKEKA